jgi:uncharacterized delta-60 repeat protein
MELSIFKRRVMLLETDKLWEKPRRVRVMLAMTLMAMLATTHMPERARAADGDLDPGFGNGGRVTTDFLRGGDDRASAVAIQKDGKIVVAGGNSGNFAVARYNPDGSLDTSFGDGGRAATAFGTSSSTANALALQPDGKIVLAGSVGNSNTGADFALARYNSDGSLDTSFDGDGRVTTHISDISDGEDAANAVAVQSADGKIIAAGSVVNRLTGADFALTRYNSDGSLDTTFDGDGKVTTDFNGPSDRARGVALQPDGRVVAAGLMFSFSFPDSFVLARYNLDGSLDPKFGTGGKVATALGATATSIALQPDGKMIVAGWSLANFFQFVLARYNSDGSLDTSFDGDGIVTADTGADFEAAHSVALQPDGKIVVAGGNQFFFLLARFNVNGSLDANFGFNGFVFTPLGDLHFSNAFGIAIQPNDGKIVSAGAAGVTDLGNDFALARHHGDGSLDDSFDGDGKVTLDWPGGFDSGSALVIQPDAKIVVAGRNGSDFALARYNRDGSLDASFGIGGRVITDFAGGIESAEAVALQPDGKIIAAGFTDQFSSDFALARYNPDGSLDTSFDGDGRVRTDFDGNSDGARAVALQADGKIVAAGGANFGRDFALARYNTDGSLDASFDGDGKVTTGFGFSLAEANGMAIQPGDGKIVAAGFTTSSGNGDFALMRYNTDGSLDLSFDGDGIAITDFIGSDRAQAIGLQPDGKIIAAGFATSSGNNDFALARYNTDGSLDTSFDGDGMVITNISAVVGEDQANGVAIQPGDGKIVAAGSVRGGNLSPFPSDFALARYNPDGSLDTSFGGDGTIATNVGNNDRAPDQAKAVAIQPNDGRIVAVGETINNGSGTDFALARYSGGADITPPAITCPPGLQAVTQRPREACAVTVYPQPVVSDDLPGATVACAPPSGSCFPVGATTVNCTATDAAGNTAACSFTVTVFDVLLRSDSDPDAELLINSFTGDYSFCCPALPAGQSPLRGRGEARSHGSTVTLSHIAPTFRLQATIDAAVGKGAASFKPVSGFVLCPIQDRNIFNNLPARCGNLAP